MKKTAYPKQFIEELRRKADIHTVVSKYVDIKRAGSNHIGRCPFHSERTPSFTLFSDHYYCFGCGAGGDVITFTMAIESLDYREAVEKLANEFGIAIPAQNAFVPSKKELLTKERCYEINLAAARIFRENLMSEKGAAARKYLQERGISRATCTRFGLGYAVDDFSYMYERLSALGFTIDEIKGAFLCGISKNGKPYDYFRNRVIFPIIDLSGKVIAFGGRIIGQGEPKYLNSSDTPVYNKRRNLYALNFAKKAALGDAGESSKSRSGELILCEGYMDVISLHQAGFTGAVATLGTAITPEQARVMARFAKNVFISYDSDSAGIAAANKAMKYLGEAGVDVKVIRVSGAKDPDEFIKKYGSDAFLKLLDGAHGEIDYKIGELCKKYDISIADEKLKLLHDACMIFASMYSDIKKEVYMQRLSELAGIPVESIRTETERMRKMVAARQKKNVLQQGEKLLQRYDDKINPEASKYPRECAVEERIIGIILLYPEFLERFEDLSKESFVTAFNAELFENIRELVSKGEFDISSLNEKYNPEQMGRIMAIKSSRESLKVNGTEVLDEQIKLLSSMKEKTLSKKASELSDEEWLESIKNKRKDKNHNTEV